jgi:cell division protein ZapA
MALRESRPWRCHRAEGRWIRRRSREQEASLAQSNGNGSVRVEIYDQTYQLRGSDPEYIGKLADYVDTKMRVVAQQASTVDSLRVAVLAALNIADEYLVLKSKFDTALVDYTARAGQLSEALDEVLEESRLAG